MPKQMFFNIPLEKQQMFLDVAIQEFTSKSFEQVSVNSIVKKANISRGSFYTYFVDLDELFNYIFEQVKIERLQYAKELINESNGDIFVFIRNLFEYDFDNFRSKHRYSLFRNYIYYIQMSKHGTVKNTIITSIFDSLRKENINMNEIFDFTKYNIAFQDFPDIAEMIMMIAVNTFLLSETDDISKEEVVKLFEKRLDVFKYGVLKR